MLITAHNYFYIMAAVAGNVTSGPSNHTCNP